MHLCYPQNAFWLCLIRKIGRLRKMRLLTVSMGAPCPKIHVLKFVGCLVGNMGM